MSLRVKLELVLFVVIGLVVFLGYTFWVHPAAHQVRPACGDLSMDPASDAERAARIKFDGYHKWSERLVGANIFVGLALLIISAATFPPIRP